MQIPLASIPTYSADWTAFSELLAAGSSGYHDRVFEGYTVKHGVVHDLG